MLWLRGKIWLSRSIWRWLLWHGRLWLSIYGGWAWWIAGCALEQGWLGLHPHIWQWNAIRKKPAPTQKNSFEGHPWAGMVSAAYWVIKMQSGRLGKTRQIQKIPCVVLEGAIPLLQQRGVGRLVSPYLIIILRVQYSVMGFCQIKAHNEGIEFKTKSFNQYSTKKTLQNTGANKRMR